MIKAAILLPSSGDYPLIALDIYDGCKSYLHEKVPGIQIFTRNIGSGADEKYIYSQIENLLIEEDVKVIIAFLDNRYAELLQPIFNATGKILILLNMGTHLPAEVSIPTSVIELSFNESLLCWLTGLLAGKEKHLQGIMVSSYYDGGYPHCFAMVNGFTKGGGQIIDNAIISSGPSDFKPNGLGEKLQESSTINTALCLLSGEGAQLTFPVISRIQKNRELHVYASPVMIDEFEKMASGNDTGNLQMKGYTSWMPALNLKANLEFKQKFNKLTGRTAGIFSLLGWETGLLLEQINTFFTQGMQSRETIAGLKKIKFDSPRGALRISEKTQQSYSPFYLVSIGKDFEVQTESTFMTTQADLDNFNAIRPEGLSSGWKNTYLCS